MPFQPLAALSMTCPSQTSYDGRAEDDRGRSQPNGPVPPRSDAAGACADATSSASSAASTRNAFANALPPWLITNGTPRLTLCVASG